VDDWREPVSIGTGIEPVWSKDGQVLFYRKGTEGELVAVDVEVADTIRVGEERSLFPAGEYRASTNHPEYDVAPNGERFLMLRAREIPGPGRERRIVLWQNFFTLLEERAGG
jgi:hypothetical protein